MIHGIQIFFYFMRDLMQILKYRSQRKQKIIRPYLGQYNVRDLLKLIYSYVGDGGRKRKFITFERKDLFWHLFDCISIRALDAEVYIFYISFATECITIKAFYPPAPTPPNPSSSL